MAKALVWALVWATGVIAAIRGRLFVGPASYRPPSARERPSNQRRVSGFVVALAVEALLLLALLTLNYGNPASNDRTGGNLSIFDVAPDSPPSPTRAAQRRPVAERKITTPLPPTIPVPKLPVRPLPILVVTKDVFAASDIARLGSKAAAADSGSQVAAAGSPGDSERVGTGPHGEPLYAAEWYREPTNRELSGYLPARMPAGGGWGLVACRTVDRFHVEDCVELGNGPPGSHLAGAVRQAAWQFLVRPPRVGGKTMVGQWVRIRIDYHVASADGSSGDGSGGDGPGER